MAQIVFSNNMICGGRCLRRNVCRLHLWREYVYTRMCVDSSYWIGIKSANSYEKKWAKCGIVPIFKSVRHGSNESCLNCNRDSVDQIYSHSLHHNLLGRFRWVTFFVGFKLVSQLSKGIHYPYNAPNQISLASKPTETWSSHPPTQEEESVLLICQQLAHLIAATCWRVSCWHPLSPAVLFAARLVPNTLSCPNWVPGPAMSRRALSQRSCSFSVPTDCTLKGASGRL